MQNPTPTTKLLLWEIHRLPALVLQANDLVRSLDTRDRALDSTTQVLLKGMRAALANEPVVQDDEARRLKGSAGVGLAHEKSPTSAIGLKKIVCEITGTSA